MHPPKKIRSLLHLPILPTLALCLLVGSSRAWAQSRHPFQLVGRDELPPVSVDGQPAKIHTQGLYVTDRHYLVTGRLERKPKRSLLLRFVRGTTQYEILDVTQFVNGKTLDHPGGFDRGQNGRFWIPVSTSNRRGPTRVCSYRLFDKKPLADAKLEQVFSVDDHIGALCCRKDNVLLMANWDTKSIYGYQHDGRKLFQKNQEDLLFRGKPNIAVQDWKSVESDQFPASNVIVMGGVDKTSKQGKSVVLIANAKLDDVIEIHRFDTPTGVNRPVTNEGLHLRENELYLLPEDIGAGAKVLRYQRKSRKTE